MRSRLGEWIRLTAATLVMLGAAAPAWPQCAMCQTAAAAQERQAAEALNFGILILFVPAVAFFSGVFLFAFRWANASTSEGDSDG